MKNLSFPDLRIRRQHSSESMSSINSAASHSSMGSLGKDAEDKKKKKKSWVGGETIKKKTTAIRCQWNLQRAELFRKRWWSFTKLGRIAHGHDTRPRCDSCSVWLKFCYVHLLTTNKFCIRTCKLHPLHFLLITLMWLNFNFLFWNRSLRQHL